MTASAMFRRQIPASWPSAQGKLSSLGLKDDGSIVAWGNNGNGQCNIPEPNTGFMAVAAGSWHSLGLKDRRLSRGMGVQQ